MIRKLVYYTVLSKMNLSPVGLWLALSLRVLPWKREFLLFERLWMT